VLFGARFDHVLRFVMANRTSKAEATIAELAVVFPAAFALDPALARPLKLGVREDLRAQCAISHGRIRAALGHYCNSAAYLEASTEGTTRIDLAGTAAGEVTATEAASARRRLAKIAKKAATQTTDKDTSKNMTEMTTIQPTHQVVRQLMACESANVPTAGSAKPAAAPVAAAPKPGPRRLGLDDLRRAAQARKAGTAG
jgi:sRNA-binding protein